jgi:class 3 adenylate cyclase
MGTLEDIQAEVRLIFATSWKKREGLLVPDPEAVRLGNDGVTLHGTVLYADLVDSTQLVDGFKDYFAAEIYKSYLVVACRIIRSEGGEITAFDGDRVMAVYVGKSKNTSAARTALKINWAVNNVINPAIKKQYPDTSYAVSQVVGIAAGPLFVAKTGIRGSNDLVWVGRAANYAAKLCSLRERGYASFITEDVFDHMHDAAKLGGSPKQSMWEKVTWTETGLTVYRSRWWWKVE